MGCTLPRAPAVRALSEGREGQLQGSSSGCLAAQTQRRMESTRLPGPLAGVCSPPHTRRLTPWAPDRCLTDVGSLALSSPAVTCAGGRGLALRVGLPPTAPAQGKQPLSQDLLEARGAPAWNPSSQNAGKVTSSGETRQLSRVQLQELPGWS